MTGASPRAANIFGQQPVDGRALGSPTGGGVEICRAKTANVTFI